MNESKGGGIGFFGALTIVFIVLKLVGVISWRWVWVLAPLWGCVVFFAFALVAALLLGMLGK